jgi:hypothetical protein
MADAAQRQQEAKHGLLAAVEDFGSEWPWRPGCKVHWPRAEGE